MAITPADIKEIIANESFGHEMRVGRVLRGYYQESETLQGGTYYDPLTNKAREFDFRWNFRHDETVLSLAVECKNIASEAPIIISGSKRTYREARHDLVESRKGGSFFAQGYLDVRSQGIVRRVAGDESIYPVGGFVGRNVLQIKPEKNKPGNYVPAREGEIYEKWSQALASGVDLVGNARRYAERFKIPHVYTVVLPVVVVPDGVLWRAEYTVSGDLVGDPERTDECEFYVAREVAPPPEFGDVDEPYQFSHLHFLTMKGFGLFLIKITREDDWRRFAFDEKTITASKAERLG